jgi:hypothetical protein
MENGRNFKISYFSAIIAAIAAIIIFCAVAVISGVMPVDSLPSNYIGAALGSLIGALITLVLLRGQTDIEEKKGKDIRILEKKTEFFQNYINTVWQVWEDQKITVDEFQKLTSQYYQNIMIYLHDKTRRETIGKELTAMGKLIDKNTYTDSQELRKSIVSVIDTLSDDIGLGGKIDADIMKEHDKILFPILFRKELLAELNKVLKTKKFKEGKYEIIKENSGDREYITFEMEQFPNVFLAIWIGGGVKKTEMVFMASYELDAEFRRMREHSGGFRYRFGLNGHPVDLSVPIPDDEDNTKTPRLDLTDEESIQVFRETKRDFPNTLAKRVLYHLGEWKEENMGIDEFFEKKLMEKKAELT